MVAQSSAFAASHPYVSFWAPVDAQLFVVSTLQTPCSILVLVRNPAQIRPEGVTTEFVIGDCTVKTN
jgi:hypothetical protein